MSLRTLEESIREYPLYQLADVVGEKRKDYSEEAIDIAEDELIFRKLKAMPPIEQIDFIKSLPNHRIAYVVNRFSNRYTSSLLIILQTEYSKRGMEEPEWYYLDNNKPIGPIKLSELKKLAEYGSVFPFTLVCKQGIQSWIDAGSVPGLFTFVNTIIPPLPQIPSNIPLYNQATSNIENKESSELGCGLSIICFMIPIIGIIVYFTEKNEKGRNAIVLALAGVIATIILYSVFWG